MSLNLVSPGVKVREVDLTIGRVDAVNEQVGAIAGPFEKGPVNVPILIETEQDLLSTFGKPISTDSQYEYWMSASNYLSYGGVLRVVRTDNANLNNANSGVDGGSPATTKIESYEDYINNHQTDATWNYAAKDPGQWANSLKVCTIDAYADQTLSGITTASIAVGMGVTQVMVGKVNPGAGSTSAFTSGYLRGVVTGIQTGTCTVKIVDQVTAAGESTPVNYSQGGVNKFDNTATTTTSTSTGIGTDVLGVIDTAYDITITGIATINQNAVATADIALGDIVTVTGGNSVVSTGTTVIGIGASTITVDKAIAGISTAGDGAKFSFTRTTSSSSTANPIRFVNVDGTTAVEDTSVTVADWYEQQTLGLANATIYWKSIAQKPATSEYASQRSSKHDEIHVVVVDDTGEVTGIAGNIVEKHLSLSKALDGKISPAENIYWKDYLATKSQYIYGGYVGAGATSGVTGTTGGNAWVPKGIGNWNGNAQGNYFSVQGNKSFSLSGGKNYVTDTGYAATLADVVSGYEKFKNQAEYQINFLIQGPSGGASMQESQAKANYLISLAELRKDCIACISPHKSGVVNVTDTDQQTENIIDFFDPINSSSYAVFDSGYKYVCLLYTSPSPRDS